MLTACKKPFPTHRCGQCEYCRVIARMDDVNRLKLEYGMRPHAFFITLTYSDECMPVFSGVAELWEHDLISFINRIREALPKVTIYAVGEYGGRLFGNADAKRDIHPHYHIALFSAHKEIHDQIREVCDTRWRLGHCHILQLSSGLIDYITGYLSDKLTNEKSMERVKGLRIAPVFTYKSRRPAIGDISDQLIDITEEHGEVTHLTLDGKKVRIPKYLRIKVQNEFLKFGLDLKNEEDKKIYELRKERAKKEKMQSLFEKEQEQMEKISLRNISGDVYSKRSQIKKQLCYNFESKNRLRKKGNSIL